MKRTGKKVLTNVESTIFYSCICRSRPITGNTRFMEDVS